MMHFDLGQLAQEVKLPVEQVQSVVELLDAGNTVPFIARFRRDQTGGLDIAQVRGIQTALLERRMVSDRKEAVLRAIESQGKLSEELKEKILQTHSLRRLEDLFVPFKPKKQTLGSLAKDRGLEPLAREILHANPAAANLDARAADFVNPDRELANTAEVLLGVGHFLAEHFSEHAEARSQLRKIFWRTARMICKQGEAVDELKDLDRQAQAEHEALRRSIEEQRHAEAQQPATEAAPAETPASHAEPPAADVTAEGASSAAATAEPDQTSAEAAPQDVSVDAEHAEHEDESHDEAAAHEEASTEEAADESAEHPAPEASATGAPGGKKPKAAPAASVSRKKVKDQVKRRKRQKAVQTFRDFFEMREPIKNLSEPRILSINRGERVRVLEVTIEPDVHAMQKQAEEVLVPADHPHGDFLRACARDAVVRLIIPALIVEARRELNDRAETYAIDIYAENLRNLLLQQPIRGRRILAIEPGYRKGCKMAAVDEVGRVLGVGMLQVVGREDWRKKGRERLVEVIQKYNVKIVAIGDGPGSRDVERMVTDVLEHDLKDSGVEYTVVPEAGAAAYGASPLAREELSKYDPSHRIAISIARRLLDPLAELVKVSPANIEVGPAHYDIKTKLLRDTLDNVVESVVSYVGVDVNRANPALLRYVSGMNQLTARRVYEYREHYGPLRNREQLKDIPGIDEKTYRLASGFTKVTGGENPLDATWIHPESYEVARKVLDALGLALETVAPLPPKPKAFAEEVLAESPAESTAAPSEPPATSMAAESTPSSVSEPAAEGSEATSGNEALPLTPTLAEVVSPAEAPAAPSEAAVSAETPPSVETPAQEAPAVSETPVVSEAPAEAEPPAMFVGDAVSVAASGETPHAAGSEETPSEPPPPSTPTPPEPAARLPFPEPPAATGHAPIPLPAEIPFNEEVQRRSADWDLDQKAQELGVGKLTLQHILAELTRPGRDPRENFPAPVLRSHRMSLDDVQPGMAMKGIVVSVVDFGAFVDIGLPESGLVHISRLANRYVRDAHDEVAVGDAIPVWVVEVDKNRGRVSLTAIEPGSERPREDRRERPKKEQPQQQPRQTGQQDQRDRRPRQQRRDQGKRGAQRPRQPAVYVVQSKKPAKPISKKMIEGKEPLRSFSDLQQFLQKKQEGDEEEAK